MKWIGYAVTAVSLFFFWATYHAWSMYHLQDDPAWLLSVVIAPLYGVATIFAGLSLARAASR